MSDFRTKSDSAEGNQGEAAVLGKPVGHLTGPALLVLAVIMWFGSGVRTPAPHAATPSFDRSALRVGPRRVALRDPAMIALGPFEYRCDACHSLFRSTWDGSRRPMQHREIIFAHGTNSRCGNCHSMEHRERLILTDGREVGFEAVDVLCAQCHGTVYRDWERGAHGKTLGSWELDSPAMRRLMCTECHDPHMPAYAPIHPLPGPNTLRMGDQSPRHRVGKSPNPLLRWLDVPEGLSHEPPAGDSPEPESIHP